VLSIAILTLIVLFIIIKLVWRCKITLGEVKHLLIEISNKIRVIYWRIKYKPKLLKAKYKAGLYAQQIEMIKSLPKRIFRAIFPVVKIK